MLSFPKRVCAYPLSIEIPNATGVAVVVVVVTVAILIAPFHADLLNVAKDTSNSTLERKWTEESKCFLGRN